MAEDHGVLQFCSRFHGMTDRIILTLTARFVLGPESIHKTGGIHIIGKFKISNISCTAIFHNTRTATKCTDILLII